MSVEQRNTKDTSSSTGHSHGSCGKPHLPWQDPANFHRWSCPFTLQGAPPPCQVMLMPYTGGLLWQDRPTLVVSFGKTTLRVGFRKKPHPFQDNNPPEREFTSVQVTSDYPKHITVSQLLPWHCDTHFQHPPKTSPFVLDKELATEVTTSTQDCCNSQALKSPEYSLDSSHHYFDLHSPSEDELGKMMGVALLTEAVGTFLMCPVAPEQFCLLFNTSGPLLHGEVKEKHRGDFGGFNFAVYHHVRNSHCHSLIPLPPEIP